MSGITFYFPSWGCASLYNQNVGTCAPLGIPQSQFIASFNAQLDQLASGQSISTLYSNAATQIAATFAGYNIPYQCNQFNGSRLPVEQCTCVTATPAYLSSCSPFVTYPIAAFLNNPFTAGAALNNSMLQNIVSLTCPNCGSKATELTCYTTFPKCITGVTGYQLVAANYCNDILSTCRTQQYFQPDAQTIITLVNKLGSSLGFSIPDPSQFAGVCALLPTTVGNSPVTGFAPNNYTSLTECPCVPLTGSNYCGSTVTHNVIGFLNSLAPSIDLVLQTLGNSATTGCAACATSVQEAVCNAGYPACSNGSFVELACLSACESELTKCNSATITSAICDNSEFAQFAFSVNATTCVNFGPIGGTCSTSSIPAGAMNLQIPSFLLFATLLIAMLFH